MVLRKMNRNSADQATLDSGPYTMQYVQEHNIFWSIWMNLVFGWFCSRYWGMQQGREPWYFFQEAHTVSQNGMANYMIANDIVFLCICERSYPRKLAFTYLSDLSTEFNTTYPATQVHSPTLRPYAFMDFDTFISRTKSTYSDTRATQNLDKLNDELRDVTKVMTKNIEDLLYRGDNLERMGEVSSRLREDSKKYRKAAVRINWELMLKQYGPIGGLGLFMIIFIWWRFF
ncbi:hypothetical protein ACHAPC_005032 [Botrytis cinerea]